MQVETGTWRDAKEAVEQLGFGEPPPAGLVPIGDTGLYTTPDTPADPWDCDRYPDSPYCGGNPLDNKPIGIEIETTVNVEPCGVTRTISATGTLGFIKLPPVTVAYIPENCREEYENQGNQKIPPPPPDDLEGYEEPPQYRPHGIDLNAKIAVCTITSHQENVRIYSSRYAIWGKSSGSNSASFIEAKAPFGENVPNYDFPHATNESIFSVKAIHQYFDSIDDNWKLIFGFTQDFEPVSEVVPLDIRLPKDYPTVFKFFGTPNSNYQVINFNHTGNQYASPVKIYVGRFGDIFPNEQISTGKSVTSINSGGTYIKTTFDVVRIVWLKVLYGDTSGRRPPGYRPPKKKCCEDNMGCCQPSNSNKSEQDLSEIKKMLKEIKKAIGTEEYPVSMPASLNADYNNSGKKTEPGTVKEHNLTSVLGRFIRYFDGVMGEWGVGFKVADADPTKPGDQPKFIQARNVADLLTESYSHIFDMWIKQYQELQLSQRHAIETMLARKVSIQNYFLLEAIVDWAGFKRKDLTRKVPFLFDIDAEGFEAFLKNKEQEIQIVDFNPEDKEAVSFPDHLVKLNQAAAIIEAVYSQKFKKDDDIPAKILELLGAAAQGVDRINSGELTKSGSQEDFDQWLRDAETAFVNRAGQGDVNNPYGVPYAQRPRLTRLGDSSEEEENAT